MREKGSDKLREGSLVRVQGDLPWHASPKLALQGQPTGPRETPQDSTQGQQDTWQARRSPRALGDVIGSSQMPRVRLNQHPDFTD